MRRTTLALLLVAAVLAPTTAHAAPPAPTIGTATAGDSQATVSWSPVTGATWYVVTAYIGYWSLGPTWFPAPATTQTVTGLSNGTEHRFRVQAYDSTGKSGFSKASNPVTPQPASPALWHADADTDVDSGSQTGFWRKEGPTSQMVIVNDPAGLYGKVYRANLTAAQIESGTDRAEFRGSYVNGSKVTFGTHGQELWYGWRSMFGGDYALDGNENDGNVMQLKGDSSCGGPAVGFTIRENRLSIRTIDGDYLGWVGPLMTTLMDGGWHDFVLHVEYGKPGTGLGWLELWLDGQQQAMANGQLRINIPTMCPDDTNVFWKLGTYGMDRGVGEGPIHWFESPRIAATMAGAVPR